jgi:nucleotide-binding universal stress UspA family protein
MATTTLIPALAARPDSANPARPAIPTRPTEIIYAAVAPLASGCRTGTPVIRQGDAKRAILAAARDLARDLIITGARGIGHFRDLVLGSPSRAVSMGNSCSTLVVTGGGASVSDGGRR